MTYSISNYFSNEEESTMHILDFNIDDDVIYESPDKGETVYVRKFGSLDRILYDEYMAIMKQKGYKG